jgi:hypothetical protein
MNCIICGKEIEKSSFTNAVLCSSECFHINFWNEKVEERDDPRIVRVDGKQYYIGNEDDSSHFRGFGGTRFVIQFFDGRKVISTNLWYNGEIPESHKELLPDNAEFIKDDLQKFAESLLVE